MDIVLSRRNLLTLLSKLDRKKLGDETKCTIVVPHGTRWVSLKAVEDEEKYRDRAPGVMHPKDTPK